MKLFALTVCAILFGSSSATAGELRTWTSKDGKFTIEGELNGFGAKGIKLKKRDGKIVDVMPADLSDDDRQFARDEFRKYRERPTMGLKHVNLADAKATFKDKGIKLPATRIGVFVVNVIDGSPTALSGVQVADVITHRRPGSEHNVFRGIGQDTIKRGESDVAKWNLTLQETTSRAVVRIVRVKLSNGDEWNEDKDNNASVTVTAKK